MRYQRILYIRGHKTAAFRMRMELVAALVFRSRKLRALVRGASFFLLGTVIIFEALVIERAYAFENNPPVQESNILAQEKLVNPLNLFEDFQYLSYQYLALRDFDKAIRYAEEAIALKNDATVVYYNLAMAYFLQHDWSQAIAGFDRLVKISKGKIDAFLRTDLNNFNNPQDLSGEDLENIGNVMILINSYPMLMRLYTATSNRGKTHSLINEYEEVLKKISQTIEPSESEMMVKLKNGVNAYLEGMTSLRKKIAEVNSEELLNSIETNLKENQGQIFGQLLTTQIQANENTALGIMEMIVKACQAYQSDINSYPDNLSVLYRAKNSNSQPYLNEKRLDTYPAKPKINGYELEYVLKDKSQFNLYAKPIMPDETGRRSFSVDSTGRINVDTPQEQDNSKVR